MSAYRLNNDAAVLRFTFDGKALEGREGDTVASALIAAGQAIVSRSFKYHRPRGVFAYGPVEPNAIFDIAFEGRVTANERGTLVKLKDGMAIRSVNSSGTADKDLYSVLDRFARFIPAAFYYKTFIWPDWHVFEPRIRAMAGLGRVDPDWRMRGRADHVQSFVDLLVIGMGPAGLAAAEAAAKAGKTVCLVDENREPGLSLETRHAGATIDGLAAKAWIERVVAAVTAAGGKVLTDTTAFGLYDHNLAALAERHGDGQPDTLHRVRYGKAILAAGSIERPLPFADNDRPGILLADAGLSYLKRHGVVAGETIVIATNNSSTFAVAEAFRDAGARVTLVDSRPDASAPRAVSLIAGRRPARAEGQQRVTGIILDDGARLPCDALLVSGGFTPTVHLYGQARGKLRFDDAIQAFVPGSDADDLVVAGAANGKFLLTEAIADGLSAAASVTGIVSGPLAVETSEVAYAIAAQWPEPGMKGRVFIDLQNDVTAKDVGIAARENFRSVEHLKRYTTLGMATDQGKTSNMNGLALMAALTGRTIGETGTTTYRPPYAPVSLEMMTGRRHGIHFNPPRRLPLDAVHRRDKAVFNEYGGWLRPAWYGTGEENASIAAEVRAARERVGLLDGSTLGKIEVIGPDAAAFLDFIFYNTVSTLKPGKCRYAFILTETGFVYDDGVLVRLADDHFIVSCSSSHVAGVHSLLEDWRQDRFDPSRIFIHNATANWATLTVTGPRSRTLVEGLSLGIDLSDAALPHMAFSWGRFGDDPVRVARISFSGDRSYEVSIRADRAEAMWAAMREAGQPLGVSLTGLEAMSIMRAEKGYIITGKDTDGLTRPMDLGLDGPLKNKKTEFIGKRSLLTEDARSSNRRQLVGLEVLDDQGPLDTGAHGVERNGAKWRSIGYVTSSYLSPTLEKPIAMGLIERGRERMGEEIDIRHLGHVRRARIVSPVAFDPEGDRLHA